jgi:hypothetical protein
MTDRGEADAIVEGREPRLAALVHRRLRLRPQQVVAEQRDERHGDDPRRHQRAADHDRQAVEERA